MKVFDTVSDGKKILSIIYDGQTFQAHLPPANFDSTNIDTPVIEEIECEDISVTAEIYIDRVVVYADIEDIEFIIEEANEIKFSSEFFHHYVPVIKYARGSKEVLQEILGSKKLDRTIVPLLDIRNDKNLKQYLQDDFITTHFLDICALSYESNTKEREAIKQQRREHKKVFGSLDDAPEIPVSEYAPYSIENILHHYESITHKEFIPVCRIETQEPATLEYSGYVNALIEKHGRLALRVMNIKKFTKHFETYLLPISKHLDNVYVIVECNKNSHNDKSIIQHIKKISDQVTIVYVRETTQFDSNKIIINSVNIFSNSSLKIYQDIVSDYHDVWYGDYLGLDRDTAIEFVPGMKPNASAYLLKIKDAMEIALLKIKHESEVGTASTKLSMQALQREWLPKLSSGFINESHCKGCKGLLSEPLNLAKAKQFCQIHNGIVLGNI